MFLTSPKARWWRWTGLVLLVLLAATYALYAARSELTHGGTAMGLGYGIASTLLILVLLAFGVRKRAYRSKLGTLEGWLQSHVVLGLLAMVLVYFHAGDVAVGYEDRVATWAYWAMVSVVGSGVFGTLVYSLVPRLLTEVQSNLEPEEISERLNRLTASMARTASGRSRAFEAVYDRLLAEAVPGRWAAWRLLMRRPGLHEEHRWAGLLGRVPPEEDEPLRKLLVLARQHRELHLRFAYRERYKSWLDVWLWVHVPLSIALLVLILTHAIAALWFL